MNGSKTREGRLCSREVMMRLFERLSFRDWVRRVAHGLREPASIGEYRYARAQLLRLSAPAAAFVVPLLFLLLLLLVAQAPRHDDQGPYPVTWMEPTAIPPDPLTPEPIVPDPTPPPDLRGLDLSHAPPSALEDRALLKPVPHTAPPLAPMPVGHLAPSRAPVIVRTLHAGREPAARQEALEKYGRRGVATEDAVLRALRWLRRVQHPDGAWRDPAPAMTGLALLTFLAHGETPASDEFGATVRNGLSWLLDNQEPDGRFRGRDAHDYSHPIAAYALCEAFALTSVPRVADAARRAVDVIIRGQHPSGGWDYNCAQSLRDDTSYMGWCAQALRAAQLAGLDNPGLTESLANAVHGFKKNADPGGGFGYTAPGAGGLTGVGVLCLQLLGAEREREVRQGLAWLERVTFEWDQPFGPRPLYYWYYITQAKFHRQGAIWRAWDDRFAAELIRSQTRLEEGQGYWESPTEEERRYGPVYSTCLCTLMLEVYYRYLPTYQIRTPDRDSGFASNEDVEIWVKVQDSRSM